MMRGSALVAAMMLAACGDPVAKPDADPVAPRMAEAAQADAERRPAVRPEMREFRQWRAVCDNGNACVAWTGSDEGGWLRIAMQAGPDARPTVMASEGFGGDDAPATVRLKIDGRDHVVATREGDAGVAAANVGSVIQAIAAARSVTLITADRTTGLPVAGAAAALLWIDERQGRLGTSTALLRRGDRPASAVPAAPALPRVQPAPAVAQGALAAANAPMGEDLPADLRPPAALEARSEVKACRAENNEYLDKAVLAARLDASTNLWGVPCGSGAYNATYVLYLAQPDGSGVRPADLPTWAPAGGEDDLWLVNPHYDAARRTLTVFPRGRGLGDCGTIQTWTWTAAGFALSEERVMGDCQGMMPEHWPTTWRTR
jgi:hypothetical protein